MGRGGKEIGREGDGEGREGDGKGKKEMGMERGKDMGMGMWLGKTYKEGDGDGLRQWSRSKR